MDLKNNFQVRGRLKRIISRNVRNEDKETKADTQILSLFTYWHSLRLCMKDFNF
jgi:hypothetical protein